MTRKMFYAISYGVMALLIVAVSVFQHFYPGVPNFIYPLIGIVLGLILLLALRQPLKESNLVLSDERTARNFAFAASVSYQVLLFGNILFVAVINSIPRLPSEWSIVNRTLVIVMLIQIIAFYVAYAARSRKG